MTSVVDFDWMDVADSGTPAFGCWNRGGVSRRSTAPRFERTFESGRPQTVFVSSSERARPEPAQLKEAMRRLSALLALDDGWAAGAPRIAVRALTTAGSYALAMAQYGVPLPDFVPMPDGGVQAEWYSPAAEVDLVVSPSGNASFYAERPDGSDGVSAGLPEGLPLLYERLGCEQK